MKAKIITIHEDCLEFDTGHKLCDYHYQECCENHYINFEYLKLEDVKDLVFDISSTAFIEQVFGYGVRLKPTNNFPVSIPGYGDNNGYYSHQLELILRDASGIEVWSLNISECQSMAPNW